MLYTGAGPGSPVGAGWTSDAAAFRRKHAKTYMTFTGSGWVEMF